MLNVKLLQEAKEWILTHPEHLDMKIGLGRNSCGTAACIAGTVCMLKAPLPVERIIQDENPWSLWGQKVLSSAEIKRVEDSRLSGWSSIESKAMEYLGITKESASDQLFYLRYWIDNHAHDYEEAKTCQEKAKVVADYIDKFIGLVEEGAIAI